MSGGELIYQAQIYLDCRPKFRACAEIIRDGWFTGRAIDECFLLRA